MTDKRKACGSMGPKGFDKKETRGITDKQAKSKKAAILLLQSLG